MVLIRAWDIGRGQQLEEPIPKLPSGYREVFKECIKYAEPAVGEYLAKILVWLQVHDARLKNLAIEQGDRSYVSPSRLNIITYLMRLGELQALVNKLFEFARSMGEFDGMPLSWDDFHSAYRLLDIDPELFHVNETANLKANTKRHLDSRQT